jgi:hypothetical protein
MAFMYLPLTTVNYARRLLNIDTIMSDRFEEKLELMLMTCPESSESKTEVKAIFYLVAHVS